MELVFIKLFLGLLMATAIIKVTGKTTLAPQAPIDQIQNYILGGIIGGTIYSSDIKILDFVKVMAVWAFISISFYYLRKKYPKISELIDGNTIRIIENGKISKKQLKKSGLSTLDVYTMLRTQAISSITDVEIGTIEKNGSLSIISKNSVEKTFIVVIDGVLNEEELSRANITESKIQSILNTEGVVKFSDLILLELDEEKQIKYIQKNN
ncbi:YetF domain-containing protein [uncultured Leuconostoc sp.]|uniref:DUF421 domain-containing protein n=1 Tax=uncultured Leuconostoc sp. TaxID=173262 RepID=UPI0025E37A27|nr:YetF domain-containing protein [uncultured Leuconostoc sp.]